MSRTLTVQGFPFRVSVTTLPNGLRVVIGHKPGPLAAAMICIGAGSADDPLNQRGAGHFLEHMVCRAKHRGKTPDPRVAFFAQHGIDFNAATSPETTCYHAEGRQTHLQDMVTKLSSLVFDPHITTVAVEHERGPIEDERRQNKYNSRERIWLFQSIVPGNAEWHTDTLGTQSSIKRMSPDTLRAYHQRWYHTNNAAIIIVGDVSDRQALALVHALEIPVNVPLPPRPMVHFHPIQATYRRSDVDSCSLFFAAPTATTSSDRLNRIMATALLANAECGLLTLQLRFGHAFSYGPAVDLMSVHNLTLTDINVTSAPKNFRCAARVVAKEVERIKTGRVPKPLFESCLANALVSMLRKIDSRTPLDWADVFSDYWQRGNWPQEPIESVMSRCTPKTIAHAAQDMFLNPPAVIYFREG